MPAREPVRAMHQPRRLFLQDKRRVCQFSFGFIAGTAGQRSRGASL